METASILHSLSPYLPREVYFVVDDALDLDLQPQLAVHVTEANKNLDTVAQIWDWLIAQHATRKALIVCIGGGVVTDLGGFAASTYRRGVDYINIPTTLLAMVDAASGGKTGINYHGLKNTIGVIRQPLDTIILPQWLDTLPAEEWLSGYAELLKTALLDNAIFYQEALSSIDNRDAIGNLVHQALAYKQRIVDEDPDEKGLRKALNLGHTIGHALEEKKWMPHGYAVLYGLVAELYLSVVQQGLDRDILRQISHLMVAYYGRPSCGCSDYDELIALMRDDKKNEQPGQINFTLLRAVGEPVLNCTVGEDLIREALDYLFTL